MDSIHGGKSKKTYMGAGSFPYRRYELEPKVLSMLNTLFNSSPVYKSEKWSLPQGKVIQKTIINLTDKNDIVIYPSLGESHWEYDKVIDYYIEDVRIRTPGYGEKYTALEYWNNEKLHQRWKKQSTNTIHQMREDLYFAIQEPRIAYISINISLYGFLAEILKEVNDIEKTSDYTPEILDILAYGERMIAAAVLGYNYTGIDVDYTLSLGISKILRDISVFKSQSELNVYYIGIENYLTGNSLKKYDIITISPPPFNTEPYAGNSEMQSYNKYSTFEDYFCKFLVEMIYKIKCCISEKGVFAFTALDRDAQTFKFRHKHDYMSQNINLVYVEALILVISSFGFIYKGAAGLRVGNKPPVTPWWIFVYNPIYKESLQSYNFLKSSYGYLLEYFSPRLIQSIGDYDLLNIDQKTMEFNSSKFKYKNIIFKPENFSTKIKLEIMRYIVQNYICLHVSQVLNINFDLTKKILGRYLMLRTIDATFDKPALCGYFVDPVFPVQLSHLINYNKYDDFLNKSLDIPSNINLSKTTFKIGSYLCNGIHELYDKAANYISAQPTTRLDIFVDENEKNYEFKLNGYENIIGYTQDNISIVKFTQNLLVNIRYETLGAMAHQYTRIKERVDVLEKICNQPLMDIYASELNNNSNYYCSLYPDIEKNSLGSAFTLEMISGAYLANPILIDMFKSVSQDYIDKQIANANEIGNSLIICHGNIVWLDVNENFQERFRQCKSKDILEFLGTVDEECIRKTVKATHIKAIYILSHSKFPTLKHDKKIIKTPRNIVVLGFISTSSRANISIEHIYDLSDTPDDVKIII